MDNDSISISTCSGNNYSKLQYQKLAKVENPLTTKPVTMMMTIGRKTAATTWMI